MVSMALGIAFGVGLGRPWLAPRALRTQAWLQLALVALPIMLDMVLLLITLRVVPPVWVIATVLSAQDAVYLWRLVVLVRAHHERNRS
jgi:hypothetical protein